MGNSQARPRRDGNPSNLENHQSAILLPISGFVIERGWCGCAFHRLDQARHLKVDTKFGEVRAETSETDESVDRDTPGDRASAWCPTQSKYLQLWHCLCQVGDDTVIYPRGTTAITGELYLDFF